MLGLAQAVNARPRPVAAKKAVTMQVLRRLALWGAVAAGALLLAVLSSRSEIGSDRIAAMFHGGGKQVATRKFDAEVETHKLAEAVRDLATDGDQIKSRLAVVEHDIDDVTGSLGKRIEAADASENGPTVSATALATASLAPVPSPAMQSYTDAFAPGTTAHGEYGVDIGSGLTMQTLRARWLAIYSAHPQLFEGLKPIAAIKEAPHGSRIELRLVAGPLPEAHAAAQLCAALAAFRLFCQPTTFEGQRLAVQ